MLIAAMQRHEEVDERGSILLCCSATPLRYGHGVLLPTRHAMSFDRHVTRRDIGTEKVALRPML